MNNKGSRPLLLTLGLLLVLAASGLAYLQLRGAEERVEQVPTRRVVVANEDIPEQERIQLRQIAMVSISEEVLPARLITRPEDAVGKFARQRIYRGDILTEDRVVSLETVRRDLAEGRPLPSPSLVLDRNQVMMVLPSRMSGSFANQSPNLLTATEAVRPGDYVDVLVTTLELPETMPLDQQDLIRRNQPWDYLRTRVMFQNLRVHNVGTFSKDPAAAAKGPDERYLTFVVDPHTALELKWLKDIVALGHANVDFVLRSPGNQDVTPAETLTAQEIRRQFGLYSRQ